LPTQDQEGSEISRDESSDNLKCGSSSSDSRVFELRSGEATLESCTNACLRDPSCVAFSGVFDSWCIGCSVPLDKNHDGAVAYRRNEESKEFIIKVKGFHGKPEDVLNQNQIQDQPDVDIDLLGFEGNLTPISRRLLKRTSN